MNYVSSGEDSEDLSLSELSSDGEIYSSKSAVSDSIVLVSTELNKDKVKEHVGRLHEMCGWNTLE